METVLRAAEALLKRKEFVRIAIDGHCGAGKSTLGAALADRLRAVLLHMDDFYVPLAEKTVQRLAQPGGNICYERFQSEVLSHPAGTPFTYRPFLCAKQALGEAVHVPAWRVMVVEGSYSLHPALRNAYDLKVFMTIDPDEQQARILRRNGPEGLKAFNEKWIPLENAYFSALNIRSLCDIVLDAQA